jgi:hypothetical protein
MRGLGKIVFGQGKKSLKPETWSARPLMTTKPLYCARVKTRARGVDLAFELLPVSACRLFWAKVIQSQPQLGCGPNGGPAAERCGSYPCPGVMANRCSPTRSGPCLHPTLTSVASGMYFWANLAQSCVPALDGIGFVKFLGSLSLLWKITRQIFSVEIGTDKGGNNKDRAWWPTTTPTEASFSMFSGVIMN